MTIHDRGYRPYDGPRLPARKRYGLMVGRMLSLAWRSGLTKTIVIIAVGPVLICGAIMFFQVQAYEQLQKLGRKAPVVITDGSQWIFTTHSGANCGLPSRWVSRLARLPSPKTSEREH